MPFVSRFSYTEVLDLSHTLSNTSPMAAMVTHPQLKDVLFAFLSPHDVLNLRGSSAATADAVDSAVEECCYEAMEGLNDTAKLCPYLSEAARSALRVRIPAGFFFLAVDNDQRVRVDASTNNCTPASELTSLQTLLQRLTRFSQDSLIRNGSNMQNPYNLDRLSMVRLAGSAPNITSLYFWMSKLNDLQALQQTLASLPHLESLQLHGDKHATLDDDTVRTIGLHAPKLKTLIVYISPIAIGLEELAAHGQQLESIDIHSTQAALKTKYIFDLARCFPCLKEVGLSCATREDPQFPLMELLRRRPLTKFRLELIDRQLDMVSLVDRLSEVSQGTLEEVYFGGKYTGSILGEQNLCWLATKCRFLKVLDLSVNFVHGVADEGMTAVGAHCHLLEYLDVTGSDVSDVGIAAVADGCPQLRALIVSKTYGSVTNASISRVALQCAKLNIFGFADTNQTISDRAVVLLIDNCPLMEIRGGMNQGYVTKAVIDLLHKKHPRCYVR